VNVTGRGTQVVRERSAKPLYVSSILTRASKLNSFGKCPRFRSLASYWMDVELSEDFGFSVRWVSDVEI
jgi:hypothetical protein